MAAQQRSLNMRNELETCQKALAEERLRCANIAAEWMNDDFQSGDARLVAAYIHRNIMDGSIDREYHPRKI